jgi:ABC-2 type transport system ATP-binding protein
MLKALAAQGRTVLVSSHLISELALTAEHVIIIGRGRLIADSTVADLTRGRSLEAAYLELTSADVEYAGQFTATMADAERNAR